MSKFTRSAATAALLSLPLGLSACGGANTTSVSSPSSSSSSSSSTTSSSSAAPSSTSTSSSSSPSSTTSSAAPSAASGGKPSKDAAAKGLSKILQSENGSSALKPAILDKIAQCILDKTYSKLTTKTLKAMASGDKKSSPDNRDATTVKAVTVPCSKAAVTPSS